MKAYSSSSSITIIKANQSMFNHYPFIGTEAALKAISKFADDSRKTVIREIVRGVDYFDENEYGKLVVKYIKSKHVMLFFERTVNHKILPYLPDVSFVKEITIKESEALKSIENLRALEKLLIHIPARSSKHEIIDFYDIKTLKELKSIQVINNGYFGIVEAKISNFNIINNISLLEQLIILNTRIDAIDLIFIEKLEFLNKVIIWGLYSEEYIQLPDIHSNLESLFLSLPVSNFKNIEDSSLHSLALNLPVARDLSSLSSLEKIKRLHLNIPFAEDLSPLSNLSNMEMLEVVTTQGKFLSEDPKLEKLKSLSLKGFGSENLKSLSNLHNLENLNLFGENIRSLQGINYINELKELFLVLPNTDDVSVINDLKNLQRLGIAHSPKITKLDLSDLENLKMLYLDDLKNLEELIMPEENIPYVLIKDCPKLVERTFSTGNRFWRFFTFFPEPLYAPVFRNQFFSEQHYWFQLPSNLLLK